MSDLATVSEKRDRSSRWKVVALVVAGVVLFGVLLAQHYSVSFSLEQDGRGREFFVDPVPGGAEEALESMGMATYANRYALIEELGEVREIRYVGVGDSACPVGEVQCLASVFAAESWSADVEVVSDDRLEYSVGECVASVSRLVDGNLDPIPDDVDVDRSTIWTHRLKCPGGP